MYVGSISLTFDCRLCVRKSQCFWNSAGDTCDIFFSGEKVKIVSLGVTIKMLKRSHLWFFFMGYQKKLQICRNSRQDVSIWSWKDSQTLSYFRIAHHIHLILKSVGRFCIFSFSYLHSVPESYEIHSTCFLKKLRIVTFHLIPSPCQPTSMTLRKETTVFWVFVDVRPTFTYSWPPVSPWFDAHGSRWTCRATVPSVLVSHTNLSPASLPSPLNLSLNVMDSLYALTSPHVCAVCWAF